MTANAKTVLVADDEPDVHAFVEAALDQDGHQVIVASNGEEALKKARSENPDLIILDVQMPKKSGFEVFAELRADDATRSIPVIMLTAVSRRSGIPFSARDMGDYMGSEPDAFIDKPIDPETLRETANKLLGVG